MWRLGKYHAATKDGVDLLFIGDSITDGWTRTGKAVWKKYYGGFRVANFGVGGDRTQNVLWRLKQGMVDGLHPKVVVLLVGTNNIGDRNTPEETSRGVTAVLRDLRTRLLDSKFILMAIFPRGSEPDNPQRKQVNAINAAIAKLEDGDVVRFIDISGRFLDAKGMIRRDLLPDTVHPSARGYEIWAEALHGPLAEMLGPPASSPDF